MVTVYCEHSGRSGMWLGDAGKADVSRIVEPRISISPTPKLLTFGHQSTLNPSHKAPNPTAIAKTCANLHGTEIIKWHLCNTRLKLQITSDTRGQNKLLNNRQSSQPGEQVDIIIRQSPLRTKRITKDHFLKFRKPTLYLGYINTRSLHILVKITWLRQRIIPHERLPRIRKHKFWQRGAYIPYSHKTHHRNRDGFHPCRNIRSAGRRLEHGSPEARVRVYGGANVEALGYGGAGCAGGLEDGDDLPADERCRRLDVIVCEPDEVVFDVLEAEYVSDAHAERAVIVDVEVW